MSSDAISKPYATPSANYSPSLSYKDRTAEINLAISRTFQAIADDTESRWSLYNGGSSYSICGIKERKLLRKIIIEASPEIKDFYALDIGAGDFEWGERLAVYLNAREDIPKDITIHIIGIRGETNLGKAVEERGRCKLYEFGQFQIETLMDEFQKHGLQLVNKIDMIVSRWCFRHLVDPLGTFIQAYDLLRPKTGHFLFDGFHFLHENENMREHKSIDFDERMIRLCLETGALFLTRVCDFSRSTDHFVVNKPDDRPCHVRKQYLDLEKLRRGERQINSNAITRFKEFKEDDAENSPVLYEGDYRGDKDMYERLRQNGLLRNSNLAWGPLQEKDAHKKTPPFHIAIASGDEEAIYRSLQEGCDINESDDHGSTPLHLAIKQNNYKLFLILLDKGALTKLYANDCSPLHLAIQCDFDGCFIAALINAGAGVNRVNKQSSSLLASPLDCAIKHKNIKAIELLLIAKAKVSDKNRWLLQDPNFASIQQQYGELINPWYFLNGNKGQVKLGS